MLGLQSGSWYILPEQLLTSHLTSLLHFFSVIKPVSHLKGLTWYYLVMHTFPGYLDSLTAGSRDIKVCLNKRNLKAILNRITALETDNNDQRRERQCSNCNSKSSSLWTYWTEWHGWAAGCSWFSKEPFRICTLQNKWSPTIKPKLFSQESMHVETG